MPPTAPPAVGIDLGTTYSVIAYLDDTGRPVSLVNAEGDLITPTMVLFDGQSVVVGKEALKAIGTEAQRVADCAKRDLGERSFHRAIEGNQYPPEALQAWVLHKLRHDAARLIGPFEKCVITVPAYFDETRRKATQDAGYMAGLDVLDIINEPTAAAVAFGFQQGFLNATGEAAKPQKVLVYDLGGGTFDVTVMEIEGRNFTALATDGDVRLGGRDWDQRIVDLVAGQFVEQHGIDPRGDANAAGRLWRECEDAKRTLTARRRAAIAYDFQGRNLRTEITLEQFHDITHDLLDRTSFTTRQTLAAAGLSWDEIDRVLLVGGSTRMPMVRQMLRELSGKEPDASVAADEAVAHGAALRAGILLAKTQGNRVPFKIKNVNAHSLGVVATDRTTGRLRNAILIPRNTPLPVSAKRVFRTQKADQKNILVQIVEGESPSPDDCSPLGKCVVRDLPAGLKAQTPIEVKFRYGEDGRLKVEVRVEGTDCELAHEITRENSLTPEQLDIWRDYIAKTAGGT
jgi:molecular chaperone DnaK